MSQHMHCVQLKGVTDRKNPFRDKTMNYFLCLNKSQIAFNDCIWFVPQFSLGLCIMQDTYLLDMYDGTPKNQTNTIST